MKTTTITTEDLITPLIDIFNSEYSIPPENEEYEISYGQFGAIEQNPNETVIALPDALPTSLTAARAIATLLWRSGSHHGWTMSETAETDPYRFPLRFAYLKRSFWLDGHWQWDRYLTVVEHLDEEIDAQAAERQIRLLVGYLRDPENLIRLEPDDLAMF